VGLRAGLDVCEKFGSHRDFCLMLRSLFVSLLHFSGIGLSMVVLCRTSLFLDCKGRFPPSPPGDAAYWPDTQRTPSAKEETIGIWPAISQFFEESWVLLHDPKLAHGTDYFTSPPKEGLLWKEKSDGFGRERTRDLVYQRPAC
jgi:hypothetical protein